MESPLPARTFVRTPFTWLTYLMLGYFAYLQAILGPLMPFLRSELSLSYTAGSLHFSVFALGVVLTGILSGSVVRRWGRGVAFWGGGIGMSVGALLVALGDFIEMTLTGAFVMGLCGTVLLVIIQASLSDWYGERRVTALTESNAVASACAMLGPLAIGVCAGLGLGWRGGLFLAMVMLGLIVWRFHGVEIPPARDRATVAHLPVGAKLPAPFWAFFALLFLVVSVEWGLGYWGAVFLEDAVGLPKPDAALLMTLFFLAVLAGRVIASRLAHLASATLLLPIALGITAIGLPLFWLAPAAPLSIAGLFIAGLGIANLYPFTVARAIGVEPAHADTAAARLSLAVGASLLSTPLILGWAADLLDIRRAFGIVGLLLLLAVATTILATHLTARHARGQAGVADGSDRLP